MLNIFSCTCHLYAFFRKMSTIDPWTTFRLDVPIVCAVKNPSITYSQPSITMVPHLQIQPTMGHVLLWYLQTPLACTIASKESEVWVRCRRQCCRDSPPWNSSQRALPFSLIGGQSWAELISAPFMWENPSEMTGLSWHTFISSSGLLQAVFPKY